jgi:hypothetical protein
MCIRDSVKIIPQPDNTVILEPCELHDPDAQIFITITYYSSILSDGENAYVLRKRGSATEEKVYDVLEDGDEVYDIHDICDVADAVLQYLIDKGIL